jgi:predicted kinase
MLIAMAGLSDTGKSTIAACSTEELGALVLNKHMGRGGPMIGSWESNPWTGRMKKPHTTLGMV